MLLIVLGKESELFFKLTLIILVMVRMWTCRNWRLERCSFV